VAKTHDRTLESIEWLLEPKPEILITGIGWDGVTKVDQKVESIKNCDVHLLKSREAIDLFNKLEKAKKRVAIHFHSAC
jgi:hypothetical protein